jgi:hypothetical protein
VGAALGVCLTHAEIKEIEKSAKELRGLQYLCAFFFLVIVFGLVLLFDVHPVLANLIAALVVLPYAYYRGNELDKKIKESKISREEAEKTRDILRTPLRHILYPPFKELVIMLIVVLAAVFGMLYFGISDEKQVSVILTVAFIAGLIPLFWRDYTKAI